MPSPLDTCHLPPFTSGNGRTNTSISPCTHLSGTLLELLSKVLTPAERVQNASNYSRELATRPQSDACPLRIRSGLEPDPAVP
jgi:hypothetical protein